MTTAIRKLLKELNSKSVLHVDSVPNVEPKRALPLGIIANLFLGNSVLLGAVLISIASILISIGIRIGTVPPTALLLFDKQIAKGVVTGIESREIRNSKGGRRRREIYRYTFVLPDGRKLNGESWTRSRNVPKGARVDVEYYPRRPECNRIEGMSASSDENNLMTIGAFLMVGSSFALGSGIRKALEVKKFLKSGSLGAATVTHCIESKGQMNFEVGGLSWNRKRIGKPIPVAEYQRLLVTEHRSKFDQQGNYIGTSDLRAFSVFYAMIFGVIGGWFVLFGIVIARDLLGPVNRGFEEIFNVRGILTAIGLGATTMALVEIRYLIFLRQVFGEKLEDTASLFKTTKCILAFNALDFPEPVTFECEMDLNGDESDFATHPILYLKRNPAKRIFLNEVALETSKCPDGGYFLKSQGSLMPLTVFLSVVVSLLACVCIIIKTFF